MKWYAVTTYSGREQKVKNTLEDRLSGKSVDEIFVPPDYKGYLFIKMDFTPEVWHLVKNTPYATGFVGGESPQPVSEDQINQMKGLVIKPAKKLKFQEGDSVNVISGAFTNFSGVVESILHEKKKVKVLVGIFGRPTSVELDFNQLEGKS